MNIKQKQDIEKINKENENKNSANAKEMNNDDLIKELEKSKEKQKNLENELNETKKNYNIAKEYNNKMQELTKEASQMIKNSIDSRDKMKEEYDAQLISQTFILPYLQHILQIRLLLYLAPT